MEKWTPVDEDKVNKHMKSLLDDYVDSADADGEDVKNIPHNNPFGNGSYSSMLNGGMMTFASIMESLDAAENSIGNAADDPTEMPVEPQGYNEDEAIEELNKIFTPVLVMQNFEKDIADKTMAEMESADVLTERSIIQFDDETRMAQLIAVCAKIIAKQKDTEAWQMYKKAAVLKKKAGLEIQKQEYNDAKTLAQKYLVSVSTTNPSSVVRDAATDLLPQTQH